MPIHVFFMLSTGLASPLNVPAGTKADILDHVLHVEKTLGMERRKDLMNPTHWKRNHFRGVEDDELLCKTVLKHNEWVRGVYHAFETWSAKPVEGGEVLTPEDAQEFWHGFEMLEVPVERWTREYYTEQMEHVYEVMRGREHWGEFFGAPKLSAKAAAAVVCLFSQYLDAHDLRLDVPDGHDYLASSYDGGYEWCDVCYKPVLFEDVQSCKGRRRKKCPIREDEA